MGSPTVAPSQVTIVVVPRERFSYTRQSLNSIYQHTQYPFQLIYVDGGSPQPIKEYLQTEAQAKQFNLIRKDYFLSPNFARNLGLRQANSKYVVFLDNDIEVTPGWLTKLVECAEETNAMIVSPLIYQGALTQQEVHFAGGKLGIETKQNNGTSERILIEKIYSQGLKVEDIRPQIQRQKTDFAEYHCMLVRREIFDKIGWLDESFLNTKEHVDLCLSVAKIGGSIYLEPDSMVAYVPELPKNWSDLHYYMLRWSNGWELASLQRLRDKWNLSENEYFQNRYQNLGWRREKTIISPFLAKIPVGKFPKRVIGKIVRIFDKIFNRYLTNRYSKQIGTMG